MVHLQRCDVPPIRTACTLFGNVQMNQIKVHRILHKQSAVVNTEICKSKWRTTRIALTFNLSIGVFPRFFFRFSTMLWPLPTLLKYKTGRCTSWLSLFLKHVASVLRLFPLISVFILSRLTALSVFGVRSGVRWIISWWVVYLGNSLFGVYQVNKGGFLWT